MIPSEEMLSVSRAYTFNKCRKQYDYKYVQKLKRAPRDMYFDSWFRMFRGNLIHSGMEAGLLQSSIEDMVRKRVVEERDRGMSKKQEDVIQALAKESIKVAEDALRWLPVDEWEPVLFNGAPMVEAELTAPLPGWKCFLGKADLVARHKPTGSQMLLDYKTRERFEGDGDDQFNTQFACYLHCLHEMGVQVDGTVIFEIKPTLPKRGPRTAVSPNTGISGPRISPDGRFRLGPTIRSREFIANFWEDFCRQAKVIAEMQDEQVYRSMSAFVCKECPYQDVCTAELGGFDVDFIKSSRYRPLNIILEV